MSGDRSTPPAAKPLTPVQQLFAASPLLESAATRAEGLRETVRAALRQAGNMPLLLAASAELAKHPEATPADLLLRAEALIGAREDEAALTLLETLPPVPGKAALEARACLAAGRCAAARRAVAIARDDVGDQAEARALDWLDAYAAAIEGKLIEGPLGKRWRHGAAAPADATIIAILDYKSPDLPRNGLNIGDWMQTLAALRHVARFDGLAWTFDDSDLGDLLQQLRLTWPAHQRVTASGAVHLAVVDRDFPAALALRFPGRRVWLLANGWYAHKSFGATRAWPAPDTIEPILTSVHIARPDDLTADRLAWLAEHAPIGARDLATLGILRGAGIASFHSGCLTMTLSTGVNGPRAELVDVDPLVAREGAPHVVHHRPHLRSADAAAALEEAFGLLLRYAGARGVRTTRLHAALPARAVGTPVTFEAARPSDPRFAGLIDLDDLAFAETAAASSDMMRDVLTSVFAGEAPAAVRGVIARHAAVERGSRLVRSAPPAALRTAAATAVTVAVAFDERYAAAARTMLASLRRHTRASIHLVALTRGLSDDVVRDLVSVVQPASLRMFDMAGKLSGVPINLADKTTISTMDRLFLPALLGDVDRMVYLDVDLMLFDDIADLASFEPGPSGIAARFLGGERNIASAIELHARGTDAAAASALRTWVGENASAAQPRFNAGVLVLSLDRMRKQRTADRAIELVERFALHDQDALNLAAFGGVSALPDRWNYLSGVDLIDRPGIVHWVGARKPWLAGAVPCQTAWRAIEAEQRRPIDRQHWMRATSYPDEWAQRAAVAAPWFPPTGRIGDIGCGAPMALRRFLAPAVEYVAADLRAWTDEVVAIDLDKGEFPDGRFAAVAMLGVLEYLEKPGLALARARRGADALIVSYCHPRSGADPASRAVRGWINAYTEDRFAELLPRFGWHIAEQSVFNETSEMRQILYRCTPGERATPPQLSPIAEAVVSQRLTYLRPAKLARLEHALRLVEQGRIGGDYVEIGVALGGSAIVIAKNARANERRFVGFDVFGMIPPPSPHYDTPDAHARYRTIAAGQSRGIDGGSYYGYRDDLLADVQAAFARNGLDVDGQRIALIEGLVEETFAAAAPERIAFAHIDCDWHDPVAFGLAALAERMAQGGLIVIDDYHNYGGARIAVDTFLGGNADFAFEDGANPILTRTAPSA